MNITHTYRPLILAGAIVLFALGGCADSGPHSPQASPETQTVVPSRDEILTMSESEAIELMRELASNVPGSDTPTSETQSWTDVFPELAVDRAASQGKYVPLPAPLTLFGFHVQAMAAANVGNVFAPLTSFVQTDEGFWGFQMAWLEQEPENRYTEIYTLNMIVDIPHMEHVDDAELLPATSGPIYDSALRVAAAIRNPESCTQRSYYEDEFFLDYIFLYPHEGKTRLYELLSIRNVLIGD